MDGYEDYHDSSTTSSWGVFGTIWSVLWSALLVVSAPIWVTVEKFVTTLQTIKWFSPERTRIQFTYYRKWCFGIVLLWTILLWAVIISKSFSDSISGVITYYTNISIIIQAVYYTLDLFTYFADPTRRTLEFYLLYIFYFPVLAQTFAVFVMVMVVFLDNATIVTENLESAGGEYSDGVVLVVERLYHVIPLIIAMVYGILRLHDISDFLLSVYGGIYTFPVDPTNTVDDQCIHARTSFIMRTSHSQVYIFYQYIVAATPFCIYVLIQNVQTVYGIDTFTNWMAVFAVLFLNLLSVVLPLDILIFYYTPSRSIPSNMLKIHKPDKLATTPQITILNNVPHIHEEAKRSNARMFEWDSLV